MISINELRIGNLVENDGHPYNVKGIRSCDPADYNEVIVEGGGIRHVFRAEELNPIAITVEMFTECGFMKMSNFELMHFMLRPKGVRMEIQSAFRLIVGESAIYIGWINDGFCFMDNRYGEFVKISDIKGVHSLQNFYYCMSGKELKIKR